MPSRLLNRIPWATLRVRLTILNTAVVLLATLAALAAVRVAGRATLYREADAVLRGEVNEIAIALRDLHPNTDALIAEIPEDKPAPQGPPPGMGGMGGMGGGMPGMGGMGGMGMGGMM